MVEHGAFRTSRLGGRLPVVIMGAGIAALLAAVILFVLTVAGVLGSGPAYSGPGTATGFGSIYGPPRAQPTSAPPTQSDAPLARILIPAIEVDAPISIKGTDAAGVMETPNGPWDVAWYDFSARPGAGSNAVFSGHVDYVDVGPAVFWRLRELAPEDIVEVRLEDGTVYRYRVAAMDTVEAATADVAKIVGATEQEMATLITCTGTFDASTGQYDKRLIVRAERMYD
ncbi:MAG: hypothetical protein A2148_01395 [Chloroflexi bacterium RBG_16_68_14]|nr:MAG: hypothetical protein A2148_01395 [Chloroflexi bacterium RBG_16_68_14]